MAATVAPDRARLKNATTWSAGCIAMRMTFSASESSPALPFAAILQGTGWSASRVPSSASAFSAARRRPPATTAKRSAPSSAGSSARATRFSSRPCALMEAMSSASAYSLAGVLRTFSGASARQLSGISRMSGSGGGAMWFMRVSMDERIGGADAALSGRHASVRAGLGSASGCCSCVARVSAAGRPAPSPEGSSGASPATGAAARRAVSEGGSARSAASSRSLAALRSAFAASRMQRALTTGSGPRSGSEVHDIQNESPARASSACRSASAGAPWIARITARSSGRGRCRCARPRARGSTPMAGWNSSPRSCRNRARPRGSWSTPCP